MKMTRSGRLTRRTVFKQATFAVGAALVLGPPKCGGSSPESSASARRTRPATGVHLVPSPSLGGRRLFPPDNPWNTDISAAPVDQNSDALIASIGLETGLHPDFGTIYEGQP